MSASSSPVAKPCRASATARFTATVDLPTPPLPEATATMAFTSGSNIACFRRAVADAARRRARVRGCLCAVNTAVALVTPGWRDSGRLDRPAHRFHRLGVRPVGQQRHLHQPAADLDPLDQTGRHDVLPGRRILDAAQCRAQGVGRGIDRRLAH